MNRIIGAIAVYLLLGLFFALTFDLLERLAPGVFNMGPQPTPLTPAGARFFYLSIITLTSVGFGDMAPVHPFARSLVMLEGILVQIYTAVLLARLVSLEILDRSRNRPPLSGLDRSMHGRQDAL
jgi:Ion channel